MFVADDSVSRSFETRTAGANRYQRGVNFISIGCVLKRYDPSAVDMATNVGGELQFSQKNVMIMRYGA